MSPAMVTVAPELFHGQLMWAARIDGLSYGSFADLEAVNLLAGSTFPGGAVLSGAPLCDYKEDTAAYLGGAARTSPGKPCGLYASRTVVWEAPAMFGVRLVCGGHLHLYVNLNPEWKWHVADRPADRKGHPAGYQKHLRSDVAALAALVDELGIPEGVFKRLPARFTA